LKNATRSFPWGLAESRRDSESDRTRQTVTVERKGTIMSFANQVAVITGASSGIGWSLAKELARQGANVGLVARRRENLEQLAAEIGPTAAFESADIADRDQAVAAIRSLSARLGPIDLLVANAGVGAPTAIEPMNTPSIRKMFEINVFGVIHAIEAALPEMLTRRQGHLAAVSSVAAFKGLPAESAYCATKSAVNTFMEGLRIQLRSRGIAVTTICPGFVTTPMTERNKFHMPWLMDADRAARLIAKALLKKKKVYTFPWQMGVLMWLARWAPDWYMARVMKRYNDNPPFVS
jgi:short-subunit dehydrogenase